MTDNNLFYVCSLIEYIARKTKNKRAIVVSKLRINGIEKLLHDAPVNHCLTFEQVGEEVTEYYKIPTGTFDTLATAKYTIPDYQDIGKLYAIIIEDLDNTKSNAQKIFDVFSSFLSDEISDFSTDLYYQNPDYLVWSYKEGKLL